ncbi:hypothetical protein HNY73_001566 [Argiope bruennichi]|uniref:Uncharacterized protein n=1 Tax=Argiope bruennichi TaxID=94029 RepID=A0A8T0G7M5_ARGBR|nr:hypothetical protein HNY73_001566 [Argiope bruennichi]
MRKDRVPESQRKIRLGETTNDASSHARQPVKMQIDSVVKSMEQLLFSPESTSTRSRQVSYTNRTIFPANLVCVYPQLFTEQRYSFCPAHQGVDPVTRQEQSHMLASIHLAGKRCSIKAVTIPAT